MYKYSDFASLDQKVRWCWRNDIPEYFKLKSIYPTVNLPLPSKKGIFTTADAKFLEKRRVGLDKFVQAMLSDAMLVKKWDLFIAGLLYIP